jgi:hypothetical protein
MYKPEVEARLKRTESPRSIAECLVKLNELWEFERLWFDQYSIYKNNGFSVDRWDGRQWTHIGKFSNCISAVAATQGWRPKLVKDYVIVCAGCGVEFISHEMHTNYHDHKCQMRDWRKQKRIREHSVEDEKITVEGSL